MRISLLGILSWDLNFQYSNGQLTPWQSFTNLINALAAYDDSTTLSIQSKLDSLSYMQLFQSNYQQVIFSQSQNLYLIATSFGSNANSSVTYYYRFLKTLQQLPQNPYPYWFLVSSFSSVYMTFCPLSSKTSISTFFYFFSSFFSCFLFCNMFDNKFKFSKYSFFVFFYKYTVSMCLSWLQIALDGYSAGLRLCQNDKLSRYGLRQNLNIFQSMQNSHAVTLTQGRRRLNMMKSSSWVILNSGINIFILIERLIEDNYQSRSVYQSNFD